ncbi:ATP-binding protein [Ramlibacter sp. AN1133]|uniref:ATP-binding protein n=1 Tax=Ramlibacter sp. AN1133 TaxID=3133429 RepID=UPI0030C53693
MAVQVCHYFRDFLESDFKRQQAPRRKVVLQTESGFRAGMRVRPYPTLESELWALISRPSGDPMHMKLQPRKHTRSLSPLLRKIISEHIDAIDDAALDRVRISCKEQIAKTYAQTVTDPEQWVEAACTHLREQMGEQVVRPLIARLDAPLQRTAYSVIDSLYAAETEMIAAVSSVACAQLSDVLAKHVAKRDDAGVDDVLATAITLDSARPALSTFFESFVAADAFLEFRDVETYATISEGVQLYLYIGTCKFRNALYPLFFVPIDVQKMPEGEGYQLSLVNQLFANRAAIEFVLQELAQAKMREWVSPIQDRINYLKPEQSIYEVARGLFGLVANSMDLAGQANLGSRSPDAATADVTLSPSLYLCVFDRGEEALVNDYEELISLAKQGGSAIVGLFEDMVRGILAENPKSIAAAVDQHWDGLSLADRMVFDSPIPLNEEQRKILLAVRHPEGRIVVVEGPPGTGKSHTITAIAADCAFNQRSCLVLSDKAEALQVVQDKLSEAMSRVRHVEDFPNPLLRLGRQDANFKKLVANQTVAQVTAYVKSMRANQQRLHEEKQDTTVELRAAIENTVDTLGSLPLAQVKRLHDAEGTLRKDLPGFVELLARSAAAVGRLADLAQPLEHAEALGAYLARALREPAGSVAVLKDRFLTDQVLAEFSNSVPAGVLEAMAAFERLSAEDARELSDLLLRYRHLRMPLFGYLFRGGAVRALEVELNRLPAARVLRLKEEGDTLNKAVEAASALRRKLEAAGLTDRLAGAWRLLARGDRLVGPGPGAAMHALDVLGGIDGAPQALLAATADTWMLTLSYVKDWAEVQQAFAKAPQFDYVGTKSKLERLNTSMMNAHVDDRLVNFMDNHRTDAKVLSQLISNRQKFPEEKFEAVRTSFPIIIASIREFGEYMPLAPELFDVVVIDEASQVSVAQALPAMLRAKKVVVLGDSKQFSNVKSSNASIAINEKYRSNLVQFFERNVSRDAEALQRLAMFDVKRSVLEFCSIAASFSIMLRKHFRSYPELISYSSSTFYDRQLQAIKVRGVPMDEVVRFDQVPTEGKAATRTSNVAEADFIAERLVELLEEESPPTVGVITPFREQHTLITKVLFNHPRGNEFEDRLRLKVMTFDSCQGDERQIIFYSMVATAGKDALNYVFPVSLGAATESVEEKLKVQRLNVGFSRAQEMIWVVHSMPLEDFRGSIGQALHHYERVLEQKHGSAADTDPSSPMEQRVLAWLQSTRFVQAQPEDVEILPQFPIGEYLKQLDPTYSHPSWRVDFLITYRSEKGPIYIVVEYDGFEFHFENGAQVHVGNHERYLRPEDVERQLTLESYGYRFLRINRFNLGADPVGTLDERLAKLVELATGEQRAKIVERLRDQAEGILSKDMRQCTRCSSIKPLQGFFDAALKNGRGGYGRVCADCKGTPRPPSAGVRRPKPAYHSRRWR